VRILLDECVDQRFRRELSGHDVLTVQEAGWAGKKNGELLTLAQERFQIFVTVDRNLSFQQNMADFKISVVVLSARTNRLPDLKLLASRLLSELPQLKPGTISIISR
jgi:predicted nuclease of predicted toxin-antitoxin system